MANYLTFEEKRQRYVFQKRVPLEVRSAFDGRTTIRVHIGRVDRAQALAKAAKLEAQFTARFRKAARSLNNAISPPAPSDVLVEFDPTPTLTQRLVATWRSDAAEKLHIYHRRLTDAPDGEWESHMHDIQLARDMMRDEARRGKHDFFAGTIRDLQLRYRFRLLLSEADRDRLSCEFNHARVQLMDDYMRVLQGEASPTVLTPLRQDLLPLVEFWGTPAMRLMEQWRDNALKLNGRVVGKTHDKYRRLAKDLSGVLGRRPAEDISTSDLNALLALWRGKGNKPQTIKDKLQCLKTLLRPALTLERRQELFKDFLVPLRRSGASRISFTDDQILAVTDTIIDGANVREADRVLTSMLLMTGARIEELYQLAPEDIIPCEAGWIINIADHRQTGHGTGTPKTASSARQITLHRGVFPVMDRWLASHTSGEYIFPQGSINKHRVRSAAASKRLNRRLRRMFPADRRLVLQSTRTTTAQIMRREGVDIRIRLRYLGHYEADIHMRHYEAGDQLNAEDLKHGSDAIGRYLLRLRRRQC